MRGAFIKLCMPRLPMTKLSFVTCTRRCWTATGRQILIAPNVLSRFKRTAIWITPALWPFACFRYQRRSALPKVSKQHSPVIRFMASTPGGNQQRVYEEIPGPGRCEASDYFCRHGQALCNWTCRGVRVRPRKPAGEKRLVKVSIRWPDNGDFNDMLMNGDQVREQVFYKKVAA